MRTIITVTDVSHNMGILEYITIEIIKGTHTLTFYWTKAFRGASSFLLSIEKKDFNKSIIISIPKSKVPVFNDIDFHNRTLIKWMYDTVGEFLDLATQCE